MFKIGDRVHCHGQAIDDPVGDCEGVIMGEGVQFSKYHKPEIYVRLDSGRSGYFYQSQISKKG
jgi:hypothetical protein